jgi:hypothetical protein
MDVVCEKIIQDRRDEMKLGPIRPPAKHVSFADTKYHLGTADWNKIDLVRIKA